ncbi:hypothetical protein OKW22_001289 [Bacilli bacterium PM5-3]|nr:hypothetical protein [Bacilli bacterium PM5-3]MDH6603344.1 hypothetical protein [Bacilli bacterium PM5-9]
MNNNKNKIITTFLLILALALTMFHLKNAIATQSKSDYLLALQMLLGIATIYVPNITQKIFKIELAQSLKYFYWLFILFAVFIGTGMKFYHIIIFWDKLLHISSAILLCAIGLSIAITLNKNNKEVNPLFIALFAFLFAATIGIFWEFHEFTFDYLLDMNMQRYLTPSGVELIGQSVLYDTMSDLLCNITGALIFTVYSLFKMRKDIGWINTYKFKKTA